MIHGIEILRLLQRKTVDGDTVFFGQLGDGHVVLHRDERKRDVWHMVLCDPSQADQSRRPEALAIAAPDQGECWHQTDMNDDIPEDLTLPQSRCGGA